MKGGCYYVAWMMVRDGGYVICLWGYVLLLLLCVRFGVTIFFFLRMIRYSWEYMENFRLKDLVRLFVDFIKPVCSQIVYAFDYNNWLKRSLIYCLRFLKNSRQLIARVFNWTHEMKLFNNLFKFSKNYQLDEISDLTGKKFSHGTEYSHLFFDEKRYIKNT